MFFIDNKAELGYVRRLGVTVHLGSAERDPAGLLSRGFDAVFVAVGLWRPYQVGLEGEDLDGVRIAGEFLAEVASGGRPDVGERVVVIGGGNVAVDAATTSVRLGAERVDLCCLESYEEMPAFRSEMDLAQREGIEFHTRTKPVRICGQGGAVVGYEGVGIRWKKPRLLVPSNAEEIPGTEFRLRVDTVIEAIGQGVLDRFQGIETDERGLIVVDDETMMTSTPGVFAGGDIVSGGATAVQAVAEGKKAAAAIAGYVAGRATAGAGDSGMGRGGEQR